MSSNRHYFLVGSSDEPPRSKKGCIIASTSVIVLLAFVMCFTVIYPSYDVLHQGGVHVVSPPSYVELCKLSRYPEFCISSLSSFDSDIQSVVKKDSHVGLIGKSMRAALKGVKELHYLSGLLHAGSQNRANSAKVDQTREVAALRDCVEVLGDASDLIHSALEALSDFNQMLSYAALWDIHTWVSASMTYHTTCIDGLDAFAGNSSDRLKLEGDNVEKLLSIALTFVVSLYSSPEEISLKYTTPPTWLKSDVARHLEDPALFIGDVIVSKDGSGHYLKIQDAVDAAPIKSKKRYTIYIRGGVYLENVDVSKSKTNLMFVGDGIGQTIISGNKNVDDGATTFTSATVAVTGNGFLARDITFRNTAGAAKHQAVALRVGADQAAFYKCSFEGYQDTLYTHSQRQFYRECMIYGTVDYIFGNAAALFQDSTLLARVPLAQQENTYTAQGRTDPNQNTGLVFQGCVVDGDSNLRKVIQNFPTYLGRPWKEYSRTVFLKSYEGSVINPAGWLEWAGDFALKTLFYGEYQCTGPGSGSAQRVSWSSQITSQAVANQFTAGKFVSGDAWLPSTSFPFDSNL